MGVKGHYRRGKLLPMVTDYFSKQEIDLGHARIRDHLISDLGVEISLGYVSLFPERGTFFFFS